MRPGPPLAGLLAAIALVAAMIAGPLAPAQAFSWPGEVVRAPAGSVQGRLALDHREFHGIPYAAPPVGANRFRPPQPAAPWSGTRDATAAAKACPQSLPVIGALPGASEDCLTLDVYTPPLFKGRDLPVMVFLYGGAYALGSTAGYDPTPLVARGGVIVVEINYRLGPFGFLALPGLAGAGGGVGNWGLLDQQAGLRWVRQNIAAFGGDARNVTLFGQSAGGNSVCQQLGSPAAKGLFDKAIVQSGACGAGLAAHDRATAYEQGSAFASAVGCADPATAAECLRGRTANELLAGPGTATTGLDLTFKPVLDGVTVPRAPIASIRAGSAAGVPLLVGGTHDEGRFFVAAFVQALQLRHATQQDITDYATATFGDRAGEVETRYPAVAHPSPDLALSSLWTDAVFSCGAQFTAEAAAQAGMPVHAYEFADPKPPLADANPFMPMGDYHAAELPYLFAKLQDLPVIYLDPTQRALSDQLIRYWTTFARTGTPDAAGGPAWPAWTTGRPQLQRLTSAGSAPFAAAEFEADHQCDFWRTFEG